MLRLAISVLWPSFLSAIMAEGFFFSFFDPADLTMIGGQSELSPIAAYTIGFFFFWAFCAIACMISLYLTRTDVPSEQPPF
jgi:hypothetical protein